MSSFASSSSPSSAPFPARIGSLRGVASLAALTAVTALSIDMSLPAQPTLARALHVGSDGAQLTLSLFLVGYAFGQLAAGHLSDGVGRRRVLLAGLALFAVAGAACAFASDLPMLLGCRTVQGVGAAAGPVVARAMVRDTQRPADAARVLSTILALLAIAPMVAPLVGGVLLGWSSWRAIFAALGATGVALWLLTWLTLDDTLPIARRRPVSLASVPRGFRRYFATRGTRLPTLLVCACFAAQFAYISDSPFVLIEGYGVPTSRFGLYFGATAVALMLGSLAGGALLRGGRSPHALVGLGVGTVLAGGVLVATGVRVAELGVMGFVVPMAIVFVGLGLTGPSATAIAMDPVPEIAGTASSAIGFLQMLAGAIAGYATTRFGGRDPRLLGEVVLGMAVVSAALGARIAASAPRTPS